MSPSLWIRAKDIFEAAVELPAEQRDRLVNESCKDNLELRKLVDDLLRNHHQTSGILDGGISELSILANAIQAESAQLLKPGDELAYRFKIIRLLGSGGMGDVYEAEDKALDHASVALKTIRGHMVQDPRMEAQFRREVYLARKVTHPNVCRVHEFFVHESPETADCPPSRICFFSMEYWNARSLKQVLQSRELPTRQAIALLTQLLEGLSAAHTAGVVHGDFKTANVLLVEKGSELRPVITDFGLAKSAKPSALDPAFGNLVGGTPQYMAPEIYAGRAPTPASDVFAFSVVASEVLGGIVPAAKNGSAGTSPVGKVLRHDVPANAQKILVRCAARHPEDRFPDAAALLSAWVPASASRTAVYARRTLIGAAFAGAAGILAAREFGIGPFAFGKPALAVLPFRAQSVGLEPLADGLADQLISALSTTRNIRVIARSSSFQFKGDKRNDFISFAKKVAADLLLSAEVSLERDVYLVNVHLHRSSDGTTIWRETFSAASRSAFHLQQQMALSVFRQLQLAFSQPVRPAPLPAAYESYVKGAYFWNKRDPESLQRALDCFQTAVRIQPDYAEAWAWLSTTYQLLANIGIPLAEARAQAGDASRRALAVDGQLGEAHLAAALLSHRFDWDWQSALRAFRRTIELEPGNARARHWYAGCLSDLGFTEQALSQIEIAHSHDPLSFAVDTAAVMYLYAAGRLDQAIARAGRVIAVEPTYFRVYPFLAASHLAKGEKSRALEVYEQGFRLAPSDPFLQAHLAYGYFQCGQDAKGEQMLTDLLQRPVAPAPLYVAMVYCGKKDKANALAWLRRGYDERDPSMTMMKVHPVFEPLRGERDFQGLLQKMRLDPASAARLL